MKRHETSDTVISDPKRAEFIRRKWRAGWDPDEIGRRLGIGPDMVWKIAAKMGLAGAVRSFAQGSKVNGRIAKIRMQWKTNALAADIRHRQGLHFENPIRVIASCATMFGFPIRVIEPETRALIDAALADRGRA